ncbi:MAG: hypothetical protein NT067_01130 [Candidatus Diapherotrites archaeon]|nr:hypothetical protein [Candidatus Diapherotrites archaeon]
MDKAGDTSTQVILWLGLIVITGIGLYWFLSHFYNAQYLFETVNNDLVYIAMQVNGHCDDNYHYFSYNPRTEQGVLDINKDALCISNETLKKCVKLYCGPAAAESVGLEKITLVEGTKNEELVLVWK